MVSHKVVLGPTLFLVFINDLLDGLNSEGKLFADEWSMKQCLQIQKNWWENQPNSGNLHIL